jgi:ribosomal protein L14
VVAAPKPPDLVVIMPVKDWVCARCAGTGDLLTMDDAGPLCMTCADLDHLVFLGAGDAALTRRAKKASVLSAVVVRWSRSRKRYERQGILVEEPALEQAEQECLADEDARMRRRERDRERRADEDVELQARMAAEIAQLFPRCPPERAEAIARHTALRGSGRVGRSAAGRALDEQAITLAVVASVRHQDTDYDSLLMSGVPRDLARDRIRPDIDRILASWA